jgi:AraC-like DNA-binding protein
MAVRQTGFTRASALGPIARIVEQGGGSITRVFQDVDLPFALLENPDVPVPLKEQFRVLHRAAREIGDAHFGAQLGRHVRIENLSAFGLWVSRADDLYDAIDRSRRGLNVFLQTATVLELRETENGVCWSIEFLDPASDGRYQNELLGLGYLIDVVRCFAGREWMPNLIRTTTTDRAATGYLEQLYGTNVSTGHRVSAIDFDRELLWAPNIAGGTRLPQTPVELGSEPVVPVTNEDPEAVAAVALLALLERQPRAAWVAAKLGMTKRSMQRRLCEEGVTFSQLLDDVLKARARELITQSRKPITEIGLELGYADTAHFSRAFKRWTGMSPRAFRKTRG